ncbi:sulfotransferase family protein [Gluconacetobacter entanii]|nr:sulfotransferase family 2 domain-containing protein [Gluconacetobacter entanii]
MNATSSCSDPAWQEAWDAVVPTLSKKDRILLPVGQWPRADVAEMRTYRYVIEVGDATVLFLYKGRLSGIPRGVLKRIHDTWRPIFANAVFVCFRRSMWRPGFLNWKREKERSSAHYGPVREFLDSRKLRRCRTTTFFVHIPKTAGTTVWEAVGNHVAAKLYCENHEPFERHPPQSADFDLIGGHVSLPIMARVAAPQDRFAAVLRDPVDRFRSAFLHCRRAHEDPKTFTKAMRLMRERPLAEFLRDPGAPMEICQQTIMLGFAFDRVYVPEVEQEIFDRACAAVEQEGNLFATTRGVARFVQTLRAKLHVVTSKETLGIRNACNPTEQARDIEEFEDSLPQIRTMIAMEQELYDRVARREAR